MCIEMRVIDTWNHMTIVCDLLPVGCETKVRVVAVYPYHDQKRIQKH